MVWNGLERRKAMKDGHKLNLGNGLEPRITRLETEIEAISRDLTVLTGDIRQFSSNVSKQSENYDKQLRELSIAVTSALGPRKTDWGVIVSCVGLVMAIGTAALSPLYIKMNSIDHFSIRTAAELRNHELLDMHPVALEKLKSIKHNISALDKKLQKESRLLIATVNERSQSLEKQFDDVKVQGSPITRERLAVLEDRVFKTKALS